MKTKLSLGACVLIALALVAFGLFYGTISGFGDDRARVTGLLSGESGLETVLYYRGSDGLNLCVVARRHLTGDADVASLEAAAGKLRDSKAGLTERKGEDERLSAAVELVSAKLKQSPSFAESARDKAYLDMLTTDLAQLSQSPVIAAYNEAAESFNRQLEAPLSGSLAKILGVKPCALYQ